MSEKNHPGERLFNHLSRTMLRTLTRHCLIAEGDRVMVMVSGDKSGCALFDLLWQARRKAPVRYELIAAQVQRGGCGPDDGRLAGWVGRLGAAFVALQTEDLAGAAERLGCNKIAVGDHREQALETLLVNLFCRGTLSALPARERTEDGRCEMIRPLVECPREDIEAYAAARGYPVWSSGLGHVPEAPEKKNDRERMAGLLHSLQREIPDVGAVMLHAMNNVHPSHLLDAEVAAAWAARPAAAPSPSPSWRRALRVLDG